MHQEGPRKWGRIWIDWNTSTPGLCWCCQFIGHKCKYHK